MTAFFTNSYKEKGVSVIAISGRQSYIVVASNYIIAAKWLVSKDVAFDEKKVSLLEIPVGSKGYTGNRDVMIPPAFFLFNHAFECTLKHLLRKSGGEIKTHDIKELKRMVFEKEKDPEIQEEITKMYKYIINIFPNFIEKKFEKKLQSGEEQKCIKKHLANAETEVAQKIHEYLRYPSGHTDKIGNINLGDTKEFENKITEMSNLIQSIIQRESDERSKTL